MPLKGNNTENNVQTRAWYKRRTGFTAIALLVTLLIVSALACISLYPQKTQTNNLASFACRLSSKNQTFTVAVEINLTDGMDQDEAIRVTAKVFDKVFQIDPQYKLARCSDALALGISGECALENGIWTVRFHLVYTDNDYESTTKILLHAGKPAMHGTRFLHQYFEVVINPFDRTVVYRF